MGMRATPLPELTVFRTRHNPPLSFRQMGDKIGVSGATIHRLESGERRPSPELCRKIEAVTKIPLHDLRPDLWSPEVAAE